MSIGDAGEREGEELLQRAAVRIWSPVNIGSFRDSWTPWTACGGELRQVRSAREDPTREVGVGSSCGVPGFVTLGG